jgi:RNA polymerase sigma-70 factor (ECF subfamily)
MIDISDESLFKKLQNGDVKSLGTLYERYKDLLFNYFLRNTGNFDRSNDLVMETFERIFKYRNSFKDAKKVRPWIFQIASNLVKDSFRKSKNTQSTNLIEVESYPVHPETSFDIKYRNTQLQKALSRLKPAQRNVVNMYYLLEMSYQDIATCENTSINNVRIRVCRALKKLKELLENTEI